MYMYTGTYGGFFFRHIPISDASVLYTFLYTYTCTVNNATQHEEVETYYLVDLPLLSGHSLDRVLGQLFLLLLGILLWNGGQVVVTHIIPTLIVIPRTIQTLQERGREGGEREKERGRGREKERGREREKERGRERENERGQEREERGRRGRTLLY